VMDFDISLSQLLRILVWKLEPAHLTR
jgi:hypothetical protein